MLSVERTAAGIRITERTHRGRVVYNYAVFGGVALLTIALLLVPLAAIWPAISIRLDASTQMISVGCGLLMLLAGWFWRSIPLSALTFAQVTEFDRRERRITIKLLRPILSSTRCLLFEDVAAVEIIDLIDMGEGGSLAPQAVLRLVTGETVPLQQQAPGGERKVKIAQQAEESEAAAKAARDALL